MFYALRPAQVADMDQPVNPVFDFNEGAEVSQVAYPAFDGGADRIFLMKCIPRIGGKLPHAKRNPALLRMHVQHNAVYMVADIH